MRHGQVEDDQESLHRDRAGEAAGQRGGPPPEAIERVGQLLDAAADPLRVEHAQRPQQAVEAVGMSSGTARRRWRRAPKPRPSTPATGRSTRRSIDAAVAPTAATNTSPRSPMPRSTSTTVGRQRLRARGLRRVGDPHDVAADVAREEVVEEGRDEKRLPCRKPYGDADVLRPSSSPQRQALATIIDEVDAAARGRARPATRAARTRHSRATSTRENSTRAGRG